jgi:hypothetical protein
MIAWVPQARPSRSDADACQEPDRMPIRARRETEIRLRKIGFTIRSRSVVRATTREYQAAPDGGREKSVHVAAKFRRNLRQERRVIGTRRMRSGWRCSCLVAIDASVRIASSGARACRLARDVEHGVRALAQIDAGALDEAGIDRLAERPDHSVRCAGMSRAAATTLS